MSLFNIALIVFLFAFAVWVFLPERVILIIAGIAAILCAVVLLVQR